MDSDKEGVVGQFNPTVKETEHLVSKLIAKKARSGELSENQVMLAKNKTWSIAEMMFRINEVDNDLVFDEVALACIYKITGER